MTDEQLIAIRDMFEIVIERKFREISERLASIEARMLEKADLHVSNLASRPPAESPETCPECKGSGESGLGFHQVCGTCSGWGAIGPEVWEALQAGEQERGEC